MIQEFPTQATISSLSITIGGRDPNPECLHLAKDTLKCNHLLETQNRRMRCDKKFWPVEFEASLMRFPCISERVVAISRSSAKKRWLRYRLERFDSLIITDRSLPL